MLLLAAVSGAVAQTAPAPPRNLIANGGFEQTANFQNLFDGVDSQNNVCVPAGNYFPIFSQGASFVSTSFSPTVSYADVNGDGLPDLAVAASDGHLYWYPNLGPKEAPNFDHGRLARTWLGPVPHVCVCDWNEDGKRDLLYGSIDGLLYWLPNLGSASEPRWAADMGKPRWLPSSIEHQGYKLNPILCAGGKEPLLVGTYAAPCFADWNQDGLNDLIVGEGSYSANSVFVWLNTGSRTAPSFKPENKFYLAYGEGREQLTPTVCDWNNDGLPDLIVGDREGQLALYLGTAGAIKDRKKIEPVPLTKFLSIGEQRKLNHIITPCAVDFNNDGLPDLIFGTPSGKIKVALGRGKREDPELGEAKEIKGVDLAKDFRQPVSWEHQNSSLMDINFPGLPEVLTASDKVEAKEGKNVFRFTWYDQFDGWAWVDWSHWWWYGESRTFLAGKQDGWVRGVFTMRQDLRPFILGKEYEFSYWVKGEKMKFTTNICYTESLQNPDKPRGSEPPMAYVHNYPDEPMVGSDWKQVRKTYVLQGVRGRVIEFGPGPQNKRTFKTEINTNDKLVIAGVGPSVYFRFIGAGEIWLDDIKLIEVAK